MGLDKLPKQKLPKNKPLRAISTPVSIIPTRSAVPRSFPEKFRADRARSFVAPSATQRKMFVYATAAASDCYAGKRKRGRGAERRRERERGRIIYHKREIGGHALECIADTAETKSIA